MKTTFLFLSSFLFSLTFFSCIVEPEEPIEEPEDFSCLKLYDDQGQDMGIYGCTTSNDWTNQTLSTEEAAYFLQNDPTPLTGTDSTLITGISAYPVPVVQDGAFHITLLSPLSGVNNVKLQLAIIDENHNVLTRVSQQIDSHGTISLMVPADKFERGGFYRVYYRVSAENAPLLFEGHGNIVVCKEPGIFDIDTGCI